MLFTREEFDKTFEQAIASLKNLELALTDPALSKLASIISAIGDVKNDPIYETVSTALFSYINELHNFNLAFTTVPSLRKDLKPKVEGTLDIVSKSISKLRKELLKDSPDYKSVLEAVGNTFFEFHRLNRIRLSYSTR